MKKLFLTLALAAFAMTANAQWILSGNVGFNSNGGTYTIETPASSVPNPKSTFIDFNPSIGYALDDNMQVGVGIIWGWYSNKNFFADADNWNKTSGMNYGLVPYFRYYFAEAGNFKFFCQADLGFTMTPKTKTVTCVAGNAGDPVDGRTTFSDLYLSVVPGANYKLGDNFSADIFIDLLGLNFDRNVTKTYTGTGDLVDTDVLTNFNLFADASAQTINAHLAHFRIGFNYHF